MLKVCLWFFLITISFIPYGYPGQTPLPMQEILKEAEDYIIVEPSRSFILLDDKLDLTELTPSQKTRWYLTKLRASIKLNLIPEIRQYVNLLVKQRTERSFFKDNLSSIFRAIGIANRKLGFLYDAQKSYECALQFTTDPKQILSITANVGVLARHLNDVNLARKSYLHGVQLAKQLEHERMVATFENNIGALELGEGNINIAEKHFRQALKGYRATNKRTGILTSGTNLLVVFAINQDTLSFQRLAPPIKKLVEAFPDNTKKALLFWVSQMNSLNLGEQLTEQQKRQLLVEFNNLESNKLRLIIKKHFESRTGLTLTYQKPLPKPKQQKFVWSIELISCLGFSDI